MSSNKKISCDYCKKEENYPDILLYKDHVEKNCTKCSQDRGKGVTIKTQAIRLIVSQSKEGDDNKVPKIFTGTITKLIKGAVRVRRLLELAENNFGIIDGFPDLTINFFRGTRL